MSSWLIEADTSASINVAMSQRLMGSRFEAVIPDDVLVRLDAESRPLRYVDASVTRDDGVAIELRSEVELTPFDQ